jgi:hypothetical protein
MARKHALKPSATFIIIEAKVPIWGYTAPARNIRDYLFHFPFSFFLPFLWFLFMWVSIESLHRYRIHPILNGNQLAGWKHILIILDETRPTRPILVIRRWKHWVMPMLLSTYGHTRG